MQINYEESCYKIIYTHVYWSYTANFTMLPLKCTIYFSTRGPERQCASVAISLHKSCVEAALLSECGSPCVLTHKSPCPHIGQSFVWLCATMCSVYLHSCIHTIPLAVWMQSLMHGNWCFCILLDVVLHFTCVGCSVNSIILYFRIKGWWVFHHYVSTFLSGVMLTWWVYSPSLLHRLMVLVGLPAVSINCPPSLSRPEGKLYQMFRSQFLTYCLYQSKRKDA